MPEITEETPEIKEENPEEIKEETKEETKEEIKIEFPECVLEYISLGEEIGALESKINIYESTIEDLEERLEKFLDLGIKAKELGTGNNYILQDLGDVDDNLCQAKQRSKEDQATLAELYVKRSEYFKEAEVLGWEYAREWKIDKIFPYCSHTWRIKKSPEEIKEELEKMEPGAKAFIKLLTAFDK